MAKENKKSVHVVKICPTVEDLRQPDDLKNSRFVCPVKGCAAFPFKTQRGLTTHTNNSHPELTRHTSANKESGQTVLRYHCPQTDCVYHGAGDLGQRWFATLGQLKYHYINTHDEKRFSCSKCGKGFGWERDRDYHQAECGKTYSCGVCSAKYPSRRALLTHCSRKDHPIPPEFEKPEKRVKANQNGQEASVSCGLPGKNNRLPPGCVKATPRIMGHSSGASDTPRPILPRGLMLLSPDSAAALSEHHGSNEAGHQHLSCNSSALVQASISQTGSPIPQALSAMIRASSQTKGPLCDSVVGPVIMAKMGNQACGAVHRSVSCPLEICHMGTQASGPALCTVDTSQITDMAVQASVEVTHSSTQIAGCLCTDQTDVENAATQATAVLVSSATQMELNRPVSAVAIQTGDSAQVSNMAIQASNNLAGFAHIATQVSGVAVTVQNISIQASEPFTSSGFTQNLANPSLYGNSSLHDVHIAPAPFPSMTLNRDSGTMTSFPAVCPPEELAVASRGMQTSVTLLPSRLKHGVMAETQTTGDFILRSAMASANVPVVKPSKQHKATGCSPGRKRSTKSSEVQTHHYSLPKKKRRVVKETQHRRKSGDYLQDSSISTQTLPGMSVQQGKAVSSFVPGQQDLPLSSSSTDKQETWDPFLSSSVPSAPSTSHQSRLQSSHLEEFLSTYTADLGVQTQDYFPTADLGVQTHVSSLFTSDTIDFGVQTLDRAQEMCTADSGVQTVTSSPGSLLGAFDGSVGYGDLMDAAMGPTSSAISAFMSSVDCGTGTEVLTLDSQTQTNTTTSTASALHVGVQFTDCGIDMDCSLSPLNLPTNQKLFESFDSDLSFSDCGTGTEDIWASTHTQTGPEDSVDDSDMMGNVFSTIYAKTGVEECLANRQTQTMVQNKFGPGVENTMSDLFRSAGSQHDGGGQNLLGNLSKGEADLNLISHELYQKDSDDSSQGSTLRSCSSTDIDQPSGAAAADMHTQTADDLLDFLMKNMETQTTEDISETNVTVADIDTQTTCSVLFTPPHPFSSSDSSFPWLEEDSMGLVTAETQTSGPFEDKGDFFSFTDMETQTTLDYLVD